MSVLAIDNQKEFKAVTWEVEKSETGQDESMIQLTDLINSCFPDDKNDMPLELMPYWSIRNSLYMMVGVILTKHNVVIPTKLRDDVTLSLVDGKGNLDSSTTLPRDPRIPQCSTPRCRWYE